MYRMPKSLPRFGAVCALALTFACNGAPSAPTTPDAGLPGTGDAAADGSTLKVNPPRLMAPIDDFQTDTRQPTFVIANAQGRFVNRPFTYEFQVMNDGGGVMRTQVVAQGTSTTAWVYPEELERDTPYRWRVRARLNDTFGPWSTVGRFRTVKEKRADNPPPGQRLPRPVWAAGIIGQVAAARPDLLRRSCQPEGGTWEFLDAVVDRLRLEDTRFGYNWKRGNVGDPSLDVIDYNWGSERDEGTTQVYIIDIIGGHCTANPSAGWNDVTDVTLASGTIGRWTSRGRF
jgi:hypothetical protein